MLLVRRSIQSTTKSDAVRAHRLGKSGRKSLALCADLDKIVSILPSIGLYTRLTKHLSYARGYPNERATCQRLFFPKPS